MRISHPPHLVRLCCGLLLIGPAIAPRAAAQEPPKDAANETAPDAAKPVKKTKWGIEIGKDTTVVDGPLRDGVIDYFAVLNEQASQGVTPATNAAVPFWQAMGPDRSHFETIDAADFFEALGAAPPPAGAAAWVGFGEFVNRQEATEQSSAFLRQSQPWDKLRAPWNKQDFPLVAAWLEANRQPLAQITRGLARPHWYTPLLRPQDQPEATLIEAALPAGEGREVARALAARGMLHAGEDRLTDAWSDALACHRLGRHVGNARILIRLLVGTAIEGMACELDVAILNQQPSRDLLGRMRKDLEGLPPRGTTAMALDRGERFLYLDAVANLAARRGLRTVFGADPGIVVRKLLSSPVDWNVTLRLGNEYYDQIVDIAALPTHAARGEAREAFEKKLKALVADRPTALEMAAIILAGSVDERMGEEIGKVLISLLLPATEAARAAETRGRTQFDLSLGAIALAEYHAAQGRFPASLDDLPKQLPPDRFAGKPLKYAGADGGCRLYSVGPDLDDDQGAPLGAKQNQLDGDLVVKLQR